MARAKAPLLINLAGLTMGGPVLIAHGTEADPFSGREINEVVLAFPLDPLSGVARARASQSRGSMPAVKLFSLTNSMWGVVSS